MNSDKDPVPTFAWRRGAAISALGALIGAIAFLLFCHALGLNFEDQGWSTTDGETWQVDRPQMIGSFVGFAVAILLFWLGFIHTTRSSRS